MHPAPSVILFTVLSGLGFGYLAALGIGIVHPYGWTAFALWAIGYGFAVAGLLAATFHLGNPQRAWRAFSQWRSSWLSREGWAAVATLVVLAPVALSDWLGLGWPRFLGLIGAALALTTVFTTSMIYGQLKSIPRWNHWSTSLLFVTFALSGGALLAGLTGAAIVLLAFLAGVMLLNWHIGDGRFAEVGATMGSATGLGSIGAVSVFEPAHTGGNYLLREMIYVVGRKHVQKLRVLAVVFTTLLPILVVLIAPASVWTTALAVGLHLIGAAAARWLFFAEAEHVVGLYYGKR